MNWHERFKAMKSGLGLTNSDIANIIGNSSDSVKSVTDYFDEVCNSNYYGHNNI